MSEWTAMTPNASRGFERKEDALLWLAEQGYAERIASDDDPVLTAGGGRRRKLPDIGMLLRRGAPTQSWG